MEPSGSKDAEALKFTASGTSPEEGVTVKPAEGGVPTAAVTVISHEVESMFPLASMTVSWAV
jgi:hypothetical protein